MSINTNSTLGTVEPTALYTGSDGNDTLVNAIGPEAKAVKAPIVSGTPTDTNTTYKSLIGLFDDEGTQISLNQVEGWDKNATLTAEWGNVELTAMTPKATELSQGGQVTLTAAYTVTPANEKLTGWSWDTSGLDANWQGQTLAGGGGAAINGVSVEPATSTTSESAPYTVEATATVSASNIATLGGYIIWPSTANETYTPGSQVTTDLIYATVTVVSAQGNEPVPPESVTIYRLYNQYTGEHLYTESEEERDDLIAGGWESEGNAWIAPAESATPVYRLYNKYNQDHYYCTSKDEASYLTGLGWSYDFGGSAAFYSANQGEVPIYQLFNPYESSNTHLWTGNFNEYTESQGRGWQGNGISWYALSLN